MKDWFDRNIKVAREHFAQAEKEINALDIQRHANSLKQVFDTGVVRVQGYAADAKRALAEAKDADYRCRFNEAMAALKRGGDIASAELTAIYESDDMKRISDRFGSLSAKAKLSTAKLIESYGKTASNGETSHGSLTEEDRLKLSISKLDGNDRVGLLGEGAGVALGAIGGVAASGTIATAAGASTLLGSTALGSALGGVFVTATPIGWVIAPALVLGAAGYGAARLVKSGSKQDSIRAGLIEKLTERLEDLGSKNAIASEKLLELKQLGAVCIAGGVMDEKQLDRVLTLVEEGNLDLELAVVRLKGLALPAGLIEPTPETNGLSQCHVA